MREAPTAITAGHICLDIIPDLSDKPPGEFSRRFAPGRLLMIGPAALSPGGPVSNTGLALHKLGVPTELMAKVGADLFGQAIRQIVAAYDPHLERGMVTDASTGTSYTIIISYPGADRMFMHNAGANDTFCASDINFELMQRAALFHFGYPPVMKRMYADEGIELAEILKRAQAAGATTSLDLTLPDPISPAGRANWNLILQRALPYVDVFLPSIEEILYMLRRQEYDVMRERAPRGNILRLVTPELLSDVARQLLAMGVKIVGLKLGALGFYLRTASRAPLQHMGRAAPTNLEAWSEREFWAPTFRVDVVGTTGSGDTTIAGFLAALLRDMEPADALTMAVAVGACNVEALDALSGLRTWEETRERIARGWTRNTLRLHAPGWKFDKAFRHWVGPYADSALRNLVSTAQPG